MDQTTVKGDDFEPYRPNIRLKSGQREGKRDERCQVVFAADTGKQYKYSPQNVQEYQRFIVEPSSG